MLLGRLPLEDFFTVVEYVRGGGFERVLAQRSTGSEVPPGWYEATLIVGPLYSHLRALEAVLLDPQGVIAQALWRTREDGSLEAERKLRESDGWQLADEMREVAHYLFALDLAAVTEMCAGPTPERDAADVLEAVQQMVKVFDRLDRKENNLGGWPR